jgi:hypothetical protein
MNNWKVKNPRKDLSFEINFTKERSQFKIYPSGSDRVGMPKSPVSGNINANTG